MACPFCEHFVEAFTCGYSISNNVPEAGDGEIVIRLIGREVEFFRFRARLGGPQWSSSVTGTMEPNAVKGGLLEGRRKQSPECGHRAQEHGHVVGQGDLFAHDADIAAS